MIAEGRISWYRVHINRRQVAKYLRTRAHTHTRAGILTGTYIDIQRQAHAQTQADTHRHTGTHSDRHTQAGR